MVSTKHFYCKCHVAFSAALTGFHAPLISDQVLEGRLGPSTVVLDHTSGFEGLLLVDDDLLGVSVTRGTVCVEWPVGI